jgi:hypothetical protein
VLRGASLVEGNDVSTTLELRIGSRPWQPTDSTRLLTELDFYDMPTAGVLEQGTSKSLFMCVDGHGTPFTVWVYAPLEADEAAALTSMHGGEAIDAEIGRLFHTKPLIAVLAVNREIRLATSNPLQLKTLALRDAAVRAVTDQAESEQQAARSLLPV